MEGKSEIAARIEAQLAKGNYSEPMVKLQRERLEIVNKAYETGGESNAYYADMMFVVGFTD